jgi:NADP-dependent 3-hydroxy acid dehydrogenase YdfG
LASVYSTIDPKQAIASKVLSGKVVLITGASSGIGAETARTLARAGAALVLVARSLEGLNVTKQNILSENASAKVEVMQVDVRDPKAAEAAVKMAVDWFGRLDLLVANAGAMTQPSTRKHLFSYTLFFPESYTVKII